jgi:hypothetical protein
VLFACRCNPLLGVDQLFYHRALGLDFRVLLGEDAGGAEGDNSPQ